MNILVVGVGGQGVLLLSDILGNMALNAGLDVKKSEVHGMSQRGGSVVSHVRYNEKVFSPTIEEGTADLIIALEKLEALRWAHFLAPSSHLIYDLHRIDPMPVRLGLVERLTDDQLDRRIAARVPGAVGVPAYDIALNLGNHRVQNMAMLGAASHYLEFPLHAYTAVISTLVRRDLVQINLDSFAAGRSAAERS